MTAERVRSQLLGVAASGLDIETFANTASEILVRALPFTAACWATADPATQMVTGAYKWGGLGDDNDQEWTYHEYEREDVYDFREVLLRPGSVTTLQVETDGDLSRSPRWVELYEPIWDISDELRAGLGVDGASWGFLALFRDGGSHFTAAEQSFLSSLAPGLALGLRAGLLVETGTRIDQIPVEGPAVLIVGADDSLLQVSLGAAARLQDLGGAPPGQGPLPFPLASLVAAARRYAAGKRDSLPRARLRTRSGRWVVAHTSPLMSPTSTSTDVVLTIEEARRRRSSRCWWPPTV